MSASIPRAFREHGGIFRLLPAWVPRPFNTPGGRLRLHPDDLFALGLARGAIKERWLGSVTPALNGPLAPPDEGLSYVLPESGVSDRFTLKDAIAELGADLLGDALWTKHRGWPAFAKLFDYGGPLFHHLHLDDARAKLTGMYGKPEAYYFPRQYNPHPGSFPVTYFGLDPSVTREALRACLLDFERRDTRITELSRAFRLELGTGWYTPPGVLHAPGSLCTYEPQWASDVAAVFENVTGGDVTPWERVVANVPEDRKRDVDFLMSLIDWEKNVDPDYRAHYHRAPRPAPRRAEGCDEVWITYGCEWFSARELSIAPGCEVVVSDPAAHDALVVQGHGSANELAVEAPGMLRFGQPSADELFVSAAAAQRGVRYRNASACEPLVVIQQFGPDHGAAPVA